MIAKIGKGQSLYGAISYNLHKVTNEKGKVLLLHRIPEKLDNLYSTPYLHHCFEPYLLANIRTEKPVRHISLNPDPADKVSDGLFIKMAQEYMGHMGYGNQPYIVFKHTDIERVHIHIVTVCVRADGAKITDSFDHPRSMAMCRDMEHRYNLIPASEKQRTGNDHALRPVDCKALNVKGEIASVVRHLPRYYYYQSLGAYNALLSIFNMTSEQVKGEINAQPKNGLIYFALNAQGEKASNPFKASLFGKQAGLQFLQEHFLQSKIHMEGHPARAVLKNTIETAMYSATDESSFKKQLVEQGINTIVRRNGTGRIYGITFIDHESRTIWNGSALGKDLSAGVFNDWWSREPGMPQNKEQISITGTPSADKDQPKEKEETYGLFDFLYREQLPTDCMPIDGLGTLLPGVQGEDYEEQEFAWRMKKKKKYKGK